MTRLLITKHHDGGKNQVSLNLLRGFEKNGIADRFVIFCNPETEKDIIKLTPNAVVIPVKTRITWKKTLNDIWIRSILLPKYIRQYQIGVLLFPACNTGIRRYRIPTVVIPHDIQSKAHKERFSIKHRIFNSFYYHFDFRLRDRIIAISDFDKQEIAMIYPACARKITKIFNPIFTDLLISSNIYKTKNPYITAVNIQHLHKNTITLIKAFNKIKDIIRHDLYLIGKINDETKFLVSYVSKYHLNDRVVFKGFIDDASLAEIIKGSALFVNSSLYEGFGMTCVESMMAGVPTLASKVTAVPEVTMGLCDYYEEPDDVNALADAIKKILLDGGGKTSTQLETISRKIYDQYNYMKISQQYYEFLTSLMQKENLE